ncbi:hypothetical protein AYO47_06820 [Planctomyces sp. SCGC AG-212-M04]|nr:hypothetical protein AYO47_06820 [Planctomyces sp. SCGC AG-212-M04]
MLQSTFVRLSLGILVVGIVGHSLNRVEAAETDKAPERPRFKTETIREEWRDAKRDRVVPVKIYLPQDKPGPAPVIVFSHGLGGSRDGYAYLGEHWSSRGFVSVHVQHAGSDGAAFVGPPAGIRGRMEKSILDPSTSLNRPKDISFVVDELERLGAEGQKLAGKLDLKKLGMAGHSFGAWTTLAIAGQKSDLPIGRNFAMADPRFKAAIAMSAPAGRPGADQDKVYSGITIPVFHMTGTLDDSPIGKSPAADRRIPFDHIAAKDQFLVTFTGGDHMVFSGRVRPKGGQRVEAPGGSGDPAQDDRFQEIIRFATTAFWEAYLNGDAAAKSWLKEGELQKLLGNAGVFEQK